jgi:transposase
MPDTRNALIHLEPDQRFHPLCHACRRPARTAHSHTRKFVRDLNLGDFSVMLQVEYRKVWCDHCRGVRVEHLEFVDAAQRVTHRLGAYAVELCRAGLSVSAVAHHLGLDPKTVKALDKAALETEFGKTDYAGLRRLAIDEIAVKKGHHYMTVVLDYDTGRVAWMGKGRKISTLDGFFRQMPPTVRKSIQAVAVDMWDAYIDCVRRWCPNADIVFDLFHVVKAFNKVIDDIRNEEFRKADAAGRDKLKGSKYLFLKNWGNLKRDQRIRLDEILAINQRLNIVYWLKDFLAHIWEYHLPGWAQGALAEWRAVAREDGHPSLVRFAKMLETHEYGIVAHCKHRMHTSVLEGVNNKIKVIKRVAYGFHDLDYFALKVKQAFPRKESSN